MANQLLKRMMIFVVVYLVISSIIAYIYRDDQEYTTIGKTIVFQGKEVDIKVLYKENEDIWAQETLLLVSGSVGKLIEGYGMNSPHDTISIYSSDLDSTDNYPFKLERGQGTVSVAVDYGTNAAVWGVSQMWIYKGFAEVPDWVLWGLSAFYAYWAMDESGFTDEARSFDTYLGEMSAEYDGDLKLASYSLPGNAEDDPDGVGYLFYNSMHVYLEIYALTSVADIADVHDGVMSSQNYQWDSSRYVTFFQEKTDNDVSEAFAPVFSGDVGSEITKWKTIYYIEIASTLALAIIIFLWAYWDNIKSRFKILTYFRERSMAGREMIKAFGSKDMIMMELETHFKKYIPDEEYEKYLELFYEEKLSKANAQ